MKRGDLTIGPGQLYIDGNWRDAQTGKTKPTFDPTTEAPIADIAQATATDLDEAILAARRAFDQGPWPRMRPAERAKFMFRIAELIDKYADDLAYRETVDMGMTYSDSRNICAPFIAECFRYYGGWCTKLDGSVRIHEDHRLGYTVREPLGVVGAISPFNFPMVLSTYKIAPALACGNTVIHKPATATPLSALRIAMIMQEAGLPEGVFQLLTGPGSVIGQGLVTSPGVNKISVTGSTATGIQIIKDAADTLKHVTAELGGKSPNIIFADANLPAAVEAATWAGFGNKGEQCFGGTRLLVEKSVYDTVLEMLAERLKTFRTGDPFDPETSVGPVADAAEYAKVLDYIRIGRDVDGARVYAGGHAAKPGKGFFIEPTLMADANNQMRIAQEEIFGPVLTVIPFTSFEEAIQIANGVPYGLASGVHTRDMNKAMAAARAIQAGVVWVNTYGQFDTGMPFGGMKSSGIGRELGPDVLENYLQTKAIWLQAN